MKPPKISVIIPTFKRPALLTRCIDALTDQDFLSTDFEIVVVSDGEDSDTRRALETRQQSEYPSLQFYELPVKSGPAAARNLGWMLARAELIAFTDDDCIPGRSWLQAIWSAYEPRKVKDVAFSGRTEVPINHEHPTDYEKNILHLASAEFITANCACAKTSLQKVGGFDERFRMAWREDSDLQFKFILHNIPIIKVHDAVVVHPVRPARWGISIREERKGMFNALLYKKYPRLYRQKIEPVPPWHYYAIVFFLLVSLGGLMMDKPAVKILGVTGWCLMTAAFAAKRLRSTSRSVNHISEMIFTSALIPVLSLFWKFYGSWKFKALLIP